MLYQYSRESQPNGISRIDSPRERGRLVRVYRQGKTYSKFFGDAKHGGAPQALQRAIAYKSEFERQHPIADLPYGMVRLPFRTRPQRNNKTGVNGISETYHMTRTGDKLRGFSVCYSPEPGVRATKRFYIDEYDNRETAFEEAVRFRQAMEQQMLRDHKRQFYESRRQAMADAARDGQRYTPPKSG